MSTNFGTLQRHADVVLLDRPPVLRRPEDDEDVVQQEVGQLQVQGGGGYDGTNDQCSY